MGDLETIQKLHNVNINLKIGNQFLHKNVFIPIGWRGKQNWIISIFTIVIH